MAVYALYVPTSRRPVGGLSLERFPSREECARALKARTLDGTSRVYYVQGAHWTLRTRDAVQEFPLADATGYMRVWRRKVGDQPDPISTPDEEWLVNEYGTVERLPWSRGREVVYRPEDPRSGHVLHAPDPRVRL